MSTYSHSHHSHSLSFNEDISEDGEAEPSTGSSWSASQMNSPSGAFLSPPPSSLRPPVEEGLQPDPGFRSDVRSSVGRFQVVEGSPNRGPVENTGNVSPIPGGEETASVQMSSHSQVHYPPVLRTFYPPQFPSMSVNGASTQLSLGISALPTKAVAISPSASGIEFSPPKLKFTATSKREATFTATPMPTAKPGKIKVCWIVTGDDAAEYTEPPCNVIQMYPEDHPLPLPSPPLDHEPSNVFSPSLSDVSEAPSNSSGSPCDATPGSARERFLASGVPRQSGRFTVIDEELAGNGNTPTMNVTVSSPSSVRQSSDHSRDNRAETPPPAVFAGGDNPFNLLARLQGCLAHLVEQNTRLREENDRLKAENSEWRTRAGFSDVSQPPQHQRVGSQPRMATIQQHGESHHPQHHSFDHAVPTFSSTQQHQRPHGNAVAAHNVRHNSLPAGGLPSSAMAAAAGGRSQPQSQHSPPNNAHHAQPGNKPTPPVVMSGGHHDKRQSLPANFAMPRNNGPPSAITRLPHANSHPSTCSVASSSSISGHPVPSAIAVTSPGGSRRTATTPTNASHPASPSVPARGPVTPVHAGGQEGGSSPHKGKLSPANPKTPLSPNGSGGGAHAGHGQQKSSRRKSQEMNQSQAMQIAQSQMAAQPAPASDQNMQHGR